MILDKAVFLVSIMQVARAESRTGLFTRSQGVRFPVVYSTCVARSVVDCCRRCQEDGDCRAVNFRSGGPDCQFVRDVDGVSPITDHGWTLFRMQNQDTTTSTGADTTTSSAGAASTTTETATTTTSAGTTPPSPAAETATTTTSAGTTPPSPAAETATTTTSAGTTPPSPAAETATTTTSAGTTPPPTTGPPTTASSARTTTSAGTTPPPTTGPSTTASSARTTTSAGTTPPPTTGPSTTASSARTTETTTNAATMTSSADTTTPIRKSTGQPTTESFVGTTATTITTTTTEAATTTSAAGYFKNNFFCKRCDNMEICASQQKYRNMSQLECYTVGMTLAQKEKSDGTELLTTLGSCQLPLPGVNGEIEYLINGTGDGDTSSPNCKRTYVRQLERRPTRYYFTDEMACSGAAAYPYLCERELLQTPKTPSAQCLLGWTHFNDSCYFPQADLKTWSEAQYSCKNLRAMLTDVTTATEQTFLESIINQIFVQATASAVWIAGYNNGTGTFVWLTSGQPMASGYNKFQANPPGDSGEDCVLMKIPDGFHWHDSDCSVRFQSICKYRLQ